MAQKKGNPVLDAIAATAGKGMGPDMGANDSTAADTGAQDEGSQDTTQDPNAGGAADFQSEIDQAQGDPAKIQEIMINTIQALTEATMEMEGNIKELRDLVGGAASDTTAGAGGQGTGQ